MKKLKYLLLPLISLLFVINVNAQADVQLTYYNLTTADNYLNTNSDKSFDDFIELVLSKIDEPNISVDDKYIYFLSNYPGTDNELYVDILVGTDITIGTYAFSNPTFTIGFNSFITDYRYTLYFQNNSYIDENLVLAGSSTTTPTFYTNYALERFASIDKYIIKTNVDEVHYTTPTGTQSSFQIGSSTSTEYSFDDYIPVELFKGSYDYSIIKNGSDDTLYCDPNDYLGQMSNVSDFTVTIKGITNVLSEQIMGSFDIISNKTMLESDWNLSFEHTPDDIISSGSLSCIANRCVFHFLASVEDDIDEDVVLNYKFTSSSMPTKIQIDTCNNNNLDLNFSYTYTNNDTNTNTNSDNTIITDDSNMNNFMQDGSLPDYSDLSDTSIIPNGPVDAILTLPLNIMNNLLNVLNTSSCQPLVLPIPFTGGQNLTLPCISTLYQKIDGLPTFLNWFSAIFSAFILYQYFINLYKWVDDTLTFRENNHFGGY